METDTSSYSNLLSEAECREIIAKACSDVVTLVSYEIVPASNDIVGYLGDYYKLKVIVERENNDRKSISFFVKSLPLKNQVHRDVIKRLQFMDKETTLYTLFEKMRPFGNHKWHPEMFLCRDDVLVLEDLFQSNYQHIPFGLNLPSFCIYPALKCIAAMHANSLVYEVKTGTNIGTEYLHLFNRSITKGNTWVNSGLKSIYTLAKLHPRFQSTDYQNFITTKLASEIEKVHELGKISEKYRNTLCHRDIWEKNMLFKKDGAETHCTLVDFQITRFIPPGIDVTLFLHMNVDRFTRRANMEKYLDYYYDNFTRFTAKMNVNLNDHISREEFNRTCDEFKLIPLVLTCSYAPIIYLPDFNVLKVLNETDPIQFQYIMNVDRSDFALENVNKYKDYGERVMEVIEEVVEYLYENKS